MRATWGQRARLGLLLGIAGLCVSAMHRAAAGEKTQQPPAAQQAAPKTQDPKSSDVKPKLALPDADKIVLLVRTSLLSVNDALQTGNFTVLRDKAAPAFRDGSTAVSLGKSLDALVEKRMDLSAVAIIAPQLTDLPSITSDGVLHLKGYFPGEPVGIGFDLAYQAVGGAWRLLGLNIGLVKSPKTAASTPAPEAKPRGEKAPPAPKP